MRVSASTQMLFSSAVLLIQSVNDHRSRGRENQWDRAWETSKRKSDKTATDSDVHKRPQQGVRNHKAQSLRPTQGRRMDHLQDRDVKERQNDV